MYARHNFVFCKTIIEEILSTGCAMEYAYFVKVISKGRVLRAYEAHVIYFNILYMYLCSYPDINSNII